MAQHDYSIANASGAVVRSDLNDSLSAIVSRNSGATAPSTTYAYMVWADTANNVLKQRNAANSAWIELLPLDDGAIYRGTHSIFVPAAAMRPTVSNGCASITDVETTAGRPDLQVLDFDATVDEHAQFQIAFPKSWDGGTITYRVYWTTTATDTDGVAWALQGVACADSDTADVSYGTAVVVTDDNQSAAEDVLVTSISSAVTIAGSPGDAEMTFFRIFRDVSDANDVMTEDARLIGVEVLFTINAGDDS